MRRYRHKIDPVGPQRRYGTALELVDYLHALGLEKSQDMLWRCRRVHELSLASLDLEADTRWLNDELARAIHSSDDAGAGEEEEEETRRGRTRFCNVTRSGLVSKKVSGMANPTAVLARQTLVLAAYGDSIAESESSANEGVSDGAQLDPDAFHYRLFSALDTSDPVPGETVETEDEAERDDDRRRRLLGHHPVDPVQRLVGRLVRHVRARQKLLQASKRQLLSPLFLKLAELRAAHCAYFERKEKSPETTALAWKHSFFGQFEDHLEEVCRWLFIFAHNASR
jgi:hypothetical protein